MAGKARGQAGEFVKGIARNDQAPDGDEGLEAYRAALRAFVSRRISDQHEVDDLVQEACTRLIARSQEQVLEEPRAYLFRIAANLITDRHRRAAPMTALIDDQLPPVRAVQEDGRRVADLQAALEAALDELGPRCRMVFILRRFDERSTGEIARELRISPRMVQKHLTHAVTHLYARLGHLTERGQ
jgi:RNA polymerase sigma-70 factor (ECF subfamily)